MIRRRNESAHSSQVVRQDAATTESYLAMIYGRVGTRDTYQSVRLSARSTYCVPIQMSMIKLWCNYVFIYMYRVFYFKFDHRRLNGGYTMCTSTESDRLVCVPGAYTTIDHSQVRFSGSCAHSSTLLVSGFIPPDIKLSLSRGSHIKKKSFDHRLSTIHLIEASDPAQ